MEERSWSWEQMQRRIDALASVRKRVLALEPLRIDLDRLLMFKEQELRETLLEKIRIEGPKEKEE